MITSLNYTLSYNDCVAQQHLEEYLIRFRHDFAGQNCFSNQMRLSISKSMATVIETVTAAFAQNSEVVPTTICYDSLTVSIMIPSVCFSIEDFNSSSNTDMWKSYDRTVCIRGYGDSNFLKNVFAYIKENLKETTIPRVTWEFMAGSGRRSQDVAIERAKPIFNEFYPWLKDENVYAYYDRFLNSDSSILVLLGETGTAKTSFIRSMIWHAEMSTMFTYEEELLKSDSLFVDFIMDERINLLVIEDADLFLTSREHDGNKIMSKFLNISDGLVSLRKKKIIFTANIIDPSKIDNALLRAGRCFDCKVFRKLTFEEALAACKVAGIEPPTEPRSYSIAELFSDSKNNKIEIVKVGFGR